MAEEWGLENIGTGLNHINYILLLPCANKYMMMTIKINRLHLSISLWSFPSWLRSLVVYCWYALDLIEHFAASLRAGRWLQQLVLRGMSILANGLWTTVSRPCTSYSQNTIRFIRTHTASRLPSPTTRLQLAVYYHHCHKTSANSSNGSLL